MECEDTLCSSQLGEASVTAYILIPVEFYTLLEWLTWYIYPNQKVTSPLQGIGVADLSSSTHTDADSSVIPMGAAWGQDPGFTY